MTDTESPEERAKRIQEQRRKRLEAAVVPDSFCSSRYDEFYEDTNAKSKPDYDFILKKDAWSEGDIAALFDIDGQGIEQFWELFYSSINAKTLTPSRVYRGWEPTCDEFFFNPADVIQWAITKDIELPEELINWRNQKSKDLKSNMQLQAEHKPNIDSSLFIEEPINQNERNTMLRLILGMAIDSYGYIPGERNTATGENNTSIKAALERSGLAADKKTISKYLAEAANIYQDARHRKT